MPRKKATLVDDVLRSVVPRKSQSFVAKLSTEDQAEILELRIQYQSGSLHQSGYAIARALIAVGKTRKWQLPGERQVFNWLSQTP